MTAPANSLPPDARRTLFFYNLLFPFVFLTLLPSFLHRMLRRGNFKDHFGQRLGLFTAQDRARLTQRPSIWVRSISVGETLVALKLARQLHAAEPDVLILLSVATRSRAKRRRIGSNPSTIRSTCFRLSAAPSMSCVPNGSS